MGTNLRLRLKPGFRDPLQSGVGFVGRETELDRLVAIFRHRPAANLLVSGHRGVGKTTLVEEALRRAKRPKTVVAKLSLPHINPDSDDSREVRSQILRSLARSLHFAVKDESTVEKDLKDRALGLYDKTYLKDLQESNQLEALTQAELRTVSSIQNETRLDPGKVVGGLLGSVGAGLVATGGVASAALVGREHGLGWALASLVLVVAAAVAAGIGTTKIKQHEKSGTQLVLDKNSATQVGTYDLSPETLEFELKELLTALHGTGITTIFVVDELDKLEANASAADASLEQHVIFTILSSLKNFFTLGSGTFVFISGEDFYAQLEESVHSESYSLAHTLFTDRVFVHVLHWRDVESLCDLLLAEPAEDQETYRRFRNYLCWESRNHAFDLLTRVGDYVSEYDDETPVLIAHESADVDGHWHEGNLPEDWVVAASLQKIVGATFDESARPGGREERFNQALWLTLLDAAKDLSATRSVVVPVEGYAVEDSKWTKHLSDRDREDLGGAVDRMLARAERYGLVSATEVVIPDDKGLVPVEGEEVPPAEGVAGIAYELLAEPLYPDDSVGTTSAPSPFEQGFLKVAETLNEVYENLSAAGLNSPAYQEIVEGTRLLVARLTTRVGRQAPPRSEVRLALDQADRLIPRIVQEGTRALVGGWANERGFTIADLDVDQTGASEGAEVDPSAAVGDKPTAVSLSEFEALRPLLVHDTARAVLVCNENTENQLLVLLMPSEDIVERIQAGYSDAASGKKGQERRIQRLPVVEVRLVPPDTPVTLPTEVLTVVTEPDPAKSWISWATSLFGIEAPKQTKKVDTKLGGWEIFRLHPTGDNMAAIKEVLSKVQFLDVATGEDK